MWTTEAEGDWKGQSLERGGWLQLMKAESMKLEENNHQHSANSRKWLKHSCWLRIARVLIQRVSEMTEGEFGEGPGVWWVPPVAHNYLFFVTFQDAVYSKASAFSSRERKVILIGPVNMDRQQTTLFYFGRNFCSWSASLDNRLSQQMQVKSEGACRQEIFSSLVRLIFFGATRTVYFWASNFYYFSEKIFFLSSLFI